MTTKPKKVKTEWKNEGKSFGWCYRKAKLYSRDVPGLLPYFYVVPFFLAYLVLDFSLRYTYRHAGVVGIQFLPAAVFTLGWALVFTGLILALPAGPRWFFRCVPLVTFVTLAVTHSGFINMMGEFFSFSILSFAGTGEYFKAEYIHIAKKVVAGATVTVLLMMIAGRFLVVVPPRVRKASVLSGLGAAAVGVALIAGTHIMAFPDSDDILFDNTGKQAAITAYHDFTNNTNSLLVSGLYQYSARDLWYQFFPMGAGELTDRDKADIQSYIADYEAEKTDNAYTGRLAGKNLILIQLEAIDTWMLTEDYMPNLYALREGGIDFTQHYTPDFIGPGTFNTEFIANTGILPATGGISSSVYARDDFAYSLANLFNAAGYTSRSFHNGDETTYDRGQVHPNLGYERYYSGYAMGMENTALDRYLMSGFETMTEGDPFFSFVITISGHGTYTEDNPIYQANRTEALAATADDPLKEQTNYVYAIGGAMETDRFIGALVEGLEKKGLLEDTALIFFTDHYNKYLLDDQFIMERKGVDNMDLIRRTDFSIWSADLEPQKIEKATSTVDILPTVANLFGLDTTGAFLLGSDGLSQGDGFVFFSSGSWYDGQTYWAYGADGGDPQRSAEISRKMALSNRILAGNYYANK